MINVEIKVHHDFIKFIEIRGHAYSGESGHDLICAGVSTAVTGVINMLETTDYLDSKEFDYQVDSGYVRIGINKSNRDCQVILETLKMILVTIENSYPKNIEIKTMEV